MPQVKSYPRHVRVAAALRREAADILQHQLGDPRVRFATVTGAELSADLREARIFVSFLSDEEPRIQAAMAALQHSGGFFRSELARRLKLRYMPEVRFVFDDLPASSLRLDALIARGLGGGR